MNWPGSTAKGRPAPRSSTTSRRRPFDYVILFSYRYYHAWHVARRVPAKAILVPTAERDPAVTLGIFGPVFRGVRGIMYNSHEERAMIQAATGNQNVPGVVVGVGSEVPQRPEPARFRRRFKMRRPFAIYIGRIDENKGCGELFRYFQRYAATFPRGLDLVLVGSAVMPIPSHPRIHHLGFLSDEDKFDALAAADLLIMPSYFESLSMVALEAWALGRPVLANGRCDVLKGQCLRSNAGTVLRELRRVCGNAVRTRIERAPAREARTERPRLLQRQLRVAGDRAEVLSTCCGVWPRTLAPSGDGGPAWMVGAAAIRPCRQHRSCCGRFRRALTSRRLPPFPQPQGSAAGHDRFARLTPRACTRCWRRSGTGMPSGTRSSASSESCAAPDSSRRSTSRPPIHDSRTSTLDYRDLVGHVRPDDVLIHHFSIGSRASRTAYALPGRMVLVYHNITPPEYFIGVHKDLVKLCFRGRRELTAYIDRCDLALGDSEYQPPGAPGPRLPGDRRAAGRARLLAPRRISRQRRERMGRPL